MSSPAPYPSEADPQSSTNPFVDIPARPMRVKVLYTFDDDNKTNCLARFPDILQVPTVPIDENTQIGVIELRTCIRAIVGASPELLSRLGQGDFTIYAYDYSEYETPQVGQGMLSSVLAAASPTPLAPAHQSKTMITGRVCKNIMGLFSNGVKETLEVKLRLVPVPKQIQSEYIKSMELYRNISPAMSAGFDPNAWSAALHPGCALGAPFEHVSTPPFIVQDSMDYVSHGDASHQHQRHMSNASFQGRPAFSRQDTSMSGPVSRVQSPALSVQNGHAQARQLSRRPSSRQSVRSERQSVARGNSFSKHAIEDNDNDGPSKKRAKITQTEWRGKASFGTAGADSLRVTASTAASIRIHKPVPTRPGMPGSSSLEPPPRVPTPVPQINGQRQSRPAQNNLLRRESLMLNAQNGPSLYPYAPPMTGNTDAIMSSPEEELDETANGTPLDFPSSPPAMPDRSSPGLPTLARPVDSGYMSGSMLECLDEEEDRSVDEEDLQMAAQYSQRPHIPRSDISFIEQNPGPPDLLPTKMVMSDQPNADATDLTATLQRELSQQRALNAVVPQAHRRASLALPPRSNSISRASDSSNLPPQPHMASYLTTQRVSDFHKPTMHRASSMIARSEAASPAPSEDSGLGKPRSGSGAKRKKQIQEQLAKSISIGEVPVYCSNCGAIETPTWRHVFTKVVNGSPEDMDTRESETVAMGTEVVERDPETKRVIKYRIIKAMRKSKDQCEMQGYQTLSVCNPCGLWFTKFKCMRPPEKWTKKPAAPRRNKSKKGHNQSDAEPRSDFYSEQPMPFSTDQIQPEDNANDTSVDDQGDTSDRSPSRLPQTLTRPRANSMQAPQRQSHETNQWTGPALDAALHRAIQSSPARFLGTQESPIELEDEHTPRPTRRLLFPSPRKDGEVKSLDDSVLPPPGALHCHDDAGDLSMSMDISVDSTMDKENQPPPLDPDDDLTHLFEGSPPFFFKTPSKNTPSKLTPPSKSVAQFQQFVKTPTPTHGALPFVPSSVNRNSRTPSHSNIDAFLPTFSSAEARALFPCTPSRYANLTSPSRGQMTPFTQHLTQLLSEANDGTMMNPFSSPGRPFDFGDMPTFLTPGRDFSGLDFDVFNDAPEMETLVEVKVEEQAGAGHETRGMA